MISVTHADLDILTPGSVRLVDTENECLKLIIDESDNDISTYVVQVSSLDESGDLTIEKEKGTHIIAHVKVGEPIEGYAVPEHKEGSINTGEKHEYFMVHNVLKTAPVTKIEVYPYEAR